MSNGEVKILDDLYDALDVLWAERVRFFKDNQDEYIRGQTNVLKSVMDAIKEVRAESELPKGSSEWLRKLRW